MKKEERVKDKKLFNIIINEGKKIRNNYFTFFYIENETNSPLFGISAPKKNGNAVIRNKLKRIVRMMIHNNKTLFKKNRNYIIIIRKSCLKKKYFEIEKEFINLIGEIK